MDNKLIGNENNIIFYEDKEGNRKVLRKKEYYNLDMIISIGFRVNSKKAIKFRTWANKIIKDYMVQGFA